VGCVILLMIVVVTGRADSSGIVSLAEQFWLRVGV